jgi:hypothetical protein
MDSWGLGFGLIIWSMMTHITGPNLNAQPRLFASCKTILTSEAKGGFTGGIEKKLLHIHGGWSDPSEDEALGYHDHVGGQTKSAFSVRTAR